MSDKLLPCPFCGGDAVFNDHYRDEVRCRRCGARMYGWNSDGAVSEWNRRSFGTDPVAIALADYLATGNFAALAVVLDEERERIDAELDRPPIRQDFLDAGMAEVFWAAGTLRFHRGRVVVWEEKNSQFHPDGWYWSIGYAHHHSDGTLDSVRKLRLALRLHGGLT